MYFYLDKDMAKNNIARCLYKSENLASDKELEAVRKYFNFLGEFLIYQGEDIPYPMVYNSETDTIEQQNIPELLEIVSEDISEPKQDFGEEDGNTYWYVNKEKAINKGLAETYMTSDKPLLNPQEYFGTDNVLCYVGETLPYFCTYLPEQDTVREATEFEKYKRGQKELAENEIVLETKKEIVILQEGQYVENDEVITIPKLEEAIKQEWDKEKHIWIDTTTDLDRVEAQYDEYETMDTPSVLKEMEMQDPTLATELINMLIELRQLRYSLSNTEKTSFRFRANVILPQPSKQLKSFKDKFKKYN